MKSNQHHYRKNISHRCAAKCLTDIAEVVLPYGTHSLYFGEYSPHHYDSSIFSMVDKIRRLKRDAEKYHALRKILKDTVA